MTSDQTSEVSAPASTEIVILGMTAAGKTFRPSDWAERLCGVLSIFGEDQRISYSPYVKPIVSTDVKSVVIDMQLQRLNPQAFEFLLAFARDNELLVRSGREHDLRTPSGVQGAGTAERTTGTAARMPADSVAGTHAERRQGA